MNGDYLPVDEVNRLCETCGIPYARTLYEGTLEACLRYPNHFITTLPSMHNCPPIKGNICEGVIIRPKRSVFLPARYASGAPVQSATSEPPQVPSQSSITVPPHTILPGFVGSVKTPVKAPRVILKNKNKQFGERSHTKHHKLDKKNIENNKIPNKVYDAIIEYATENRLRNILSKIGGVTHKDFGRILRDMKQDVQEDFDKDHISKWEPLNVSDTKYVHKRLNNYIATMIKENLEEIVDGTF